MFLLKKKVVTSLRERLFIDERTFGNCPRGEVNKTVKVSTGGGSEITQVWSREDRGTATINRNANSGKTTSIKIN
jgi:hypothetical protein